jgi:hypothetical protein
MLKDGRPRGRPSWGAGNNPSTYSVKLLYLAEWPLAYYEKKLGKRAGRNGYNALHREYKKQNRQKINVVRRCWLAMRLSPASTRQR